LAEFVRSRRWVLHGLAVIIIMGAVSGLAAAKAAPPKKSRTARDEIPLALNVLRDVGLVLYFQPHRRRVAAPGDMNDQRHDRESPVGKHRQFRAGRLQRVQGDERDARGGQARCASPSSVARAARGTNTGQPPLAGFASACRARFARGRRSEIARALGRDIRYSPGRFTYPPSGREKIDGAFQDVARR